MDETAIHDLASRLELMVCTTDDLTICRTVRGKAFSYTHEGGRKVGRKHLKRIESLVIPPAWKDVRIAPDGTCHLQALGTDDKGRVQYIYHPRWEDVRHHLKAERLRRFGEALPDIRKRADADLRKSSVKTMARAVAVTLLDLVALRPGSERHLKATGARGLTTLKKKNVRVTAKGAVKLHFNGKGGKEHQIILKSRKLAKKIQRIRRNSPNGRLFAFRDGTRLSAAKLNDYMKTTTGIDISAKDFRTFKGSAEALDYLKDHPPSDKKASAKAVAGVAKHVAKILRNTPAVARSSYIHPVVMEAYENGSIDDGLFRGMTRKGLTKQETALMRLLERQKSEA